MFERWIVGIHVLGRAGHPGDATGTREKLDMQRIYTKAALLSLALFAGPGIFTATANPITSNAIVATSTLALAGSNDRREQQEAKRARKEARRVSRSSETVTKSARREQKSEAKHQRREERRQSEHVRREERRDAQHQRRLAESAAEQRANRHGRDRRHTSSRHSNSHNRHSSHRNSRHGSHHNSHHSSGIHIGIGGGDIHFGVHSSGTHRYRNRSYYESYRPPPTTYVEREIVVIEREVPVREANILPGSQWVVQSDVGLTYAALPPRNAEIVAGEWWPADYSGDPLISLDADVARDFGIGLGDQLTVNVLGREVSGQIASLREIDWTDFDINFLIMFSPGVLDSAPQTHLATVRATPAAELVLERALAADFSNVTPVPVRAPPHPAPARCPSSRRRLSRFPSLQHRLPSSSYHSVAVCRDRRGF